MKVILISISHLNLNLKKLVSFRMSQKAESKLQK